MVSRSRMRTPRKRKAWALARSTVQTGQALSLAGAEVISNLLDEWQTDMGVDRSVGLTSMRIVGKLELGNLSTATVSGYVEWYWGIAWLPNIVATASAGDTQIPDPSDPGEREAVWIQTGCLRGFTQSSVTSSFAAQGEWTGSAILDITQMRKQPTTSHQLCLIGRAFGPADTDPNLWFNLATMVALS